MAESAESERQKVRVETTPNFDSDRTLTVETVNAEPDESSNLDLTEDESQVLLSGYGTEYRLMIDRSWTGNWQRVTMTWPSRPEGISVSEITEVEA